MLEYWIVDPRRKKIEVWTLTTDFYELAGAFSPGEYAASGLLPGFKVRVADIFAVACVGHSTIGFISEISSGN